MKIQTKEFLKKKKFVIGVPIVVKFRRKMKPSEYATFRATKGTEVVKLSDVRKAFKIEKDFTIDLIKRDSNYGQGYILNEDIEGWLK